MLIILEMVNVIAVLVLLSPLSTGFWSSGQVLKDGAQADRLREVEDLPEYLVRSRHATRLDYSPCPQCGGAHAKEPPRRGGPRKRRARTQGGPSTHTGAQTAKKRKAGSRVKAKDAFKGEGKALNADLDEEAQKKLGTGFRKKAGRLNDFNGFSYSTYTFYVAKEHGMNVRRLLKRG